MVRILYSLALFVTREADRLFPPIEHHIYDSTGFLLFLLTQIDKKPSPSAFGTYICLRLQKISLFLQRSLVQKPEAYSHPHRRWAARCSVLLVDVKMPWHGGGAAIDTISLTSLAWCAGQSGMFVVHVCGAFVPSLI